MILRRRILVAFLTALALASALPAAAQVQSVVLVQIPAGANRAFDLTIGACGEDGCQITVHLSDNDRRLDTLDTAWRTADRDATRDDAAAAREILTANGPSAMAWSFGEEATWSVLAAHPVHLASGAEGLLLMQMGGFEHTKREFLLLGAQDGALRELWRGGDGPARPYVSWIEHQPRRSGDRLFFFSAFLLPDPDELETLSVCALAFDASNSTTLERPAGLWSVVGGVHTTPESARSARDASANEAPFFLVLDADVLPRRTQERAALIAVTTNEARARAWRNQARNQGFGRSHVTRFSSSC